MSKKSSEYSNFWIKINIENNFTRLALPKNNHKLTFKPIEYSTFAP